MVRCPGALAVVLALAGCADSHSPGDDCPAFGRSERFGTTADAVDLLVVVDSSESMAEEHERVREAVGRIAAILASGDLEIGRPDDSGAGIQDVTPVRDLHVGVVTTHLGSGGTAVGGCDGSVHGDDGVFRTQGDPTHDPRLDCRPAYPRIQVHHNENASQCVEDPSTCVDFGEGVTCVAAVGASGCGFEQPLEAALKALVPDDPSCDGPYCTFSRGTRGHGADPRTNGGFLRPHALLAIVVITDEDDCSVADEELFDPRSSRFAGHPDLRCVRHPEALHPVDRYVDGFLSLKADPRLLFFSVVAGTPADLIRAATDPASGRQDHDRILAGDAMRIRPAGDGSSLRPSCRSDDASAVPPRRLVEVARGLAARGARSTVSSICIDSLRPAIARVLRRVGRVLMDDCLEVPLRRATDGLVDCHLVERTDPNGLATCRSRPSRTLLGEIRDEDTGREAEVCEIAQAPVTADRRPSGPGWFYDDFTADHLQYCGDPARGRISYTVGAEPAPFSTLELVCLEPCPDDAACPPPAMAWLCEASRLTHHR